MSFDVAAAREHLWWRRSTTPAGVHAMLLAACDEIEHLRGYAEALNRARYAAEVHVAKLEQSLRAVRGWADPYQAEEPDLDTAFNQIRRICCEALEEPETPCSMCGSYGHFTHRHRSPASNQDSGPEARP